jgi:hypothetical protein
MTGKEKIISFLQNCPEGIDDDELTKALGLKRRQHTNILCRQLEQQGLIVRRPVQGKIHNFLSSSFDPLLIPANTNKPNVNGRLPKFDCWHWEGNIQTKVVKFLEKEGFTISSTADTASHQQGIDIVARKDSIELWVTVKGYPQGTERTNPTVQAAHWFHGAIFDILVYRERSKNNALAVALPDFPRYHSLAQKIVWFKPTAKFAYFWVKEDGSVTVE